MRDGGDKSTSGKCLSKSSACLSGNGKLFSLTFILIVWPEIKTTMYFTKALKFIAFESQHFVIWA